MANSRSRPERALTYQELEARVVGLSADVSRLTAERDEAIGEAELWQRRATYAYQRLDVGDAHVAVLREAIESAAEYAARATPDFERWFKESDVWTGSDYLWLNRFRDTCLELREARASLRSLESALPSGSGVVGVGEAEA